MHSGWPERTVRCMLGLLLVWLSPEISPDRHESSVGESDAVVGGMCASIGLYGEVPLW